jgi:UDP-3-O-[3-hydroxymyristoyl] N-acetylglucosamine deacetylase/3-hydroxyacyl-[acyl-carrier-protein] dehydratase
MDLPDKKNVSSYDVNKVLYDINDIMKILPHREPFLLIDKILELSPMHVVGVKNVSMNEDYFRGHFPGNPVMPGVLLVEAMAQTGGILVLKTVPDPQNYLTYFLKIENARFRNKVVPGDTVIFVLHLLEPIRRGLCYMKGTAYVDDKIVMEATMMAQIIRVKDMPSPAKTPVNPN